MIGVSCFLLFLEGVLSEGDLDLYVVNLLMYAIMGYNTDWFCSYLVESPSWSQVVPWDHPQGPAAVHDVLCCRDLFSLALWVRLFYVVGSPRDCAIKSRLMDISFLYVAIMAAFRICTCFDLQRWLWDSTSLVELGRLSNILCPSDCMWLLG